MGSMEVEPVDLVEVHGKAVAASPRLEMHAGVQKQRDGEPSRGMFRQQQQKAGTVGGTSGGAGG